MRFGDAFFVTIVDIAWPLQPVTAVSMMRRASVKKKKDKKEI